MKTINNKPELKNLVCTIMDSADKTREKLQNMSTRPHREEPRFRLLA